MYKLLIPAIVIFVLTSCNQENLIFYPEKLPNDYAFNFNANYSEFNFKVDKNTSLNGLLFRCKHSKGLIFYLHGNAGSLRSWGNVSELYLKNNYDCFIFDYRGYGKSTGTITNEQELYSDLQLVYDSIKTMYAEKNIVIIGYSIGTGLAAYLASKNYPKLLILNAPYYNLTYLANQYVSYMPAFALKFKLKTNEYLNERKCPLVLFHGNKDEVIHISSSFKLKECFKPRDTLIILDKQEHNGINENTIYREEIRKLLRGN